MAAITRRMAINNAHTILKNYRKKINDANQYKEYLPLVGQQIIERYKNNSDNYKTLLDEATDSKSFFIGMGDETLISYNNICNRLNNIFDLNVTEKKKINGFIDEQFVVRSAEEVITGIRTVEIGRKVEYKLGTKEILDAEKTVDGILDRFYIEWEVEDVDNNFSTEHNKAEAVTENIIDFFDNKFSNPYDRTFEAVKEGRYIIKAKVHDKFDCNEIVDIIDFEQIVEHGDDSIISMEFKEKILEALKLTDWSIKIDFVAFSQALVQATVALCFLGGLSTVAPEVTLLIIALIAAGTKLKATFDTIRGIVVIVEALTLIEKARSKRALQVGGQKIKEGLLYLGEGALEFIIAKCTMRNVANARIQVLRNVTPQPQVLPQTALPAPNVAGALPVKATTGLPAINATAEEVTLLMNKSAMQAMENVAEMAVVQSEKVELQEIISTEKLPGTDSVVQAETEKKQIQSKELILNAEKKLHANINEKPLAVEEILAKIASEEKPPEILVKISTGSSENYGTIAQAQKEYCFVCDYEELRGLSNKDIQKKLGFETFNDIDLYATFIIPPKKVKVERVTFDSLKNDVRKKLLVDEKFSDNIKGIQDLNLFEDNVLNEIRLDEIFKIYENTFGIDAVDNLTEELYDFRKVIEDAFGTNSLFTGNYHTTTIDGEVGVREYIIKRIGNDWDKERLGKEGFSIYETKILAGEKNE